MDIKNENGKNKMQIEEKLVKSKSLKMRIIRTMVASIIIPFVILMIALILRVYKFGS